MKDETVFITGASSGIGHAAARRFHELGARVVLLARRREPLEELADEFGRERVHLIVADLNDRPTVEAALQTMPAEFSEVSILVNNAGCAVGVEPAWEADMDDWETMLEVNVKALLWITRRLLPGMVDRDRGHIINIGSVAGRYPYKGGNVYGATKAFVEQFSHNLRCDLLGKKIRVTNIEPGLVETEFSVVRFRGDHERADAVYSDIEAMTGDDIAEAIVWCASVPRRMNINRIEMMATMQVAGGFAFHRG
jgi:3-hydroxy acid dehydrogenase / malonic semialdehyde reductase